MDLDTADQQKTFIAEKQIAYARALIIVFGTVSFFLISNPFIQYRLAYILLAMIWLYGAYVLWARPYERFPVFLASWFTALSDCIFATLWIYATGGFESPYYVMLYTSIIAVAFRFSIKTTLVTASLYTICYYALIAVIGQLHGNEALAATRCGFIFIIGFMTWLITRETLLQTQQKLVMQSLVEEGQRTHQLLTESQAKLSDLNRRLLLSNKIFGHAEENAQIGSYAWNLQDQTIQYSDNMYRLLGYEPGDFEPSLERFLVFIHPDDQEKMVKSAEIVMSQQAAREDMYRIITKQGDVRHCFLTGKIIDEAGSTMMIGTMQDVTNDVLLSDSLQEKNLELERSNGELASFNYIASHDLQEPVRKIQTFTRMILENEEVTEKARHYLGRISHSATRMQHLIEAFLNYSRIDHSGIVLEETDLNKVLSEVLLELHDTISGKQASVVIGALPVIQGEPFQLHQLFINLLGNALKYSRAGIAPRVQVLAERIEPGSPTHPALPLNTAYWHITVSDNGIGFNPEYAGRIFEVFQRLHGNDTYIGTGIGLAICKKVMTTHQGLISAEGREGEGAVFHVYLPADL